MQQDPEHPTGVAADPGERESTKALVNARERKASAALELRSKGADWHDIAEILGYPTARQALIAVENALKRNLEDEESKEQMRAMVRAGLNSVLRTTMVKATDVNHPEQLAAAGKAREIYAQWAKLYGLDAPTEISVTTPSDRDLEAWVETVRNQGQPPVEEADIFDVDWSEDDEDALAPE